MPFGSNQAWSAPAVCLKWPWHGEPHYHILITFSETMIFTADSLGLAMTFVNNIQLQSWTLNQKEGAVRFEMCDSNVKQFTWILWFTSTKMWRQASIRKILLLIVVKQWDRNSVYFTSALKQTRIVNFVFCFIFTRYIYIYTLLEQRIVCGQ